MPQFWHTLTRRVDLPVILRAGETFGSLSYTGRALFYCFAALAVASTFGLLYLVNMNLVVPTPARGGSLTEGIIGTPRFINPILAVSDADRDLTSLVYSGLLRATPEGGFAPDLAQSYTVSPDGRTYTFVIRSDAAFSNGSPLTAEDVAYTIGKIEDPALHSPLLPNWQGVTVQVLDERTLSFTLRSAYAPFAENLTLGIVPKALWQGVSDDEFPFSNLNTTPVGSGPYVVSTISRSTSGIPSSYALSANPHYALGEPYLATLTFKFYQSEQALEGALRSGDVESASGVSPQALGGLGDDARTAPLSRVFGVFFNQSQSVVLRDASVREALNDAVDRQDLIKAVLGGYGTPLEGPVPPQLLSAAPPADGAAAQAGSSTLPMLARQKLLDYGWTLTAGVLTHTVGKGKSAQTTPLHFTLATADVPELRAAAQYLKQAWGEMGAQVDVQVYDQGDLSQNVIRPRKFDALLFGEVVGRELDLFAFWHSSQRNDPGLNIAGYANPQVDKDLVALRTATDPAARQQLLGDASAQIQKDLPAVFLYAPDFVYSIPNDIAGVDLGSIETPSDRFLSVPQWHRDTDYVWPIFVGK
jgi:peptide/nickel transport system substrate-binding protein